MNEVKFTDDNARDTVVAALLTASNFGMELKSIGDNVKIENNRIHMDKLSKNNIEQHYYN